MNNQFNSANLTAAAQSHAQMTPHVAATSPPQTTSATVLNSFYNAAHSQQPQHHHHRLYADPRQLHLPANTLDKSYYTTAGAAAAANALGAALGTPQRFYTTATGPTLGTNTPGGHVPAPAASHPNTILITNNFTHQQTPAQSPEQQKMSSLNPGNIRIVASSSANPANLSSISSGYQQAQHVFNLNNMFPQHLLQQQQQNFQHAPEIITQHFSGHSAHFPTTQNATATGTTALQMPQYYMASESTMASQLPTNPKILSNIPSSAVSGASGNVASSTMNVGGGAGGNTNNNGSSTVVLDRINICINNLYTDTSSSSASNSLASTPAQQPSPIIPAIQHRPIIETGPPVTPGDLYESSVLVIDEPDSTTTATTPHTPPTTPENTPPPVSNNPNVGTNNNTITTTTSSTGNSPSTSSTSMTQPQDIKISNAITTTKQHFATVAQNIEEAAVQESSKSSKYIPPLKTAAPNTSSSATHTHSCTPITQTTTSHCNQKTIPSNTPLTPPTPPSPELPTLNVTMETSPTAVTAPPLLFANGEDVFIKRQDGRFYLGTVMDNARNQFLVRFDDKTEQWCNADEMKKLGGGSTSSDTASENRKPDQPMCVACKQQQIDSQVEICERCGRGYHRKCTMETTKDSGVWICRRCDKPMKLSNNNNNTDDDDDEEVEIEVCRQLPYDVSMFIDKWEKFHHTERTNIGSKSTSVILLEWNLNLVLTCFCLFKLNSLTWDNKHRVNEQQIYCYCGKSGRFDHNMLQCCRCLNWYHTECTQIFRGNLLRGDK